MKSGHTEPDMWLGVKRCRIKDGDTVPAGLHLNWQVGLETAGRFGVMENTFEWCVFEGCAVDITSDPVVVEDGSTLHRSTVI